MVVGMGLLKNELAVGNALVDMYARCNDFENAQAVLKELPVKDVISWNGLITGYANVGKALEAMSCFVRMQNEGLSPDPITFTCLLKACSNTRAIGKGKEIHNEIVGRGLLEKDTVLGNALVDMYAKCGLIDKALEVCESLSLQNVVSWSTIIAAYAHDGQFHEALICFERMKSAGIAPNVVTLICALKACGNAGAVDSGKQIHEDIVSRGWFGKDPMLTNALIDMYAKCGMLVRAKQVLEQLPNRDLVAWNALIAGCAQQRDGGEALKCFERIQNEGLSPDAITFQCLLMACNYAGLLGEAQAIFNDMSKKYGVLPTVEHHTCMVVGFGCIGEFDKAVSVIKVMPCPEHPAVWLALLGACKRWGNVRLARVAFDQVVQLDDGCAGAYVLIAAIFSGAGMQEDVQQVEAMMLKCGLRKEVENLFPSSRIRFPKHFVEHVDVDQYKPGPFSERQSRIS
jgi:pentatricopeptide repeat protein